MSRQLPREGNDVKQLEQSESCTCLGVVNSRREPLASDELLAIRCCSLFTAAEIDGNVVQAVCVNHNEIFVAGLRGHTDGVNVSELYAKPHRLEGRLLEVSPIPMLAIVQISANPI